MQLLTFQWVQSDMQPLHATASMALIALCYDFHVPMHACGMKFELVTSRQVVWCCICDMLQGHLPQP